MSIARNPIAGEPIAVASAEPAGRKPPGKRVIIVYADRVATPDLR